MGLRTPLVIPPAFRSVDGAVAGIAELARQFEATRDLRGLFAITYLGATGTIARWIERGVFLDGATIARCLVAFADAYRRALTACTCGEPSLVSMAWRQSFDACEEGRGTALQCLLLGINAHINRDLPYALIAAGVDVNSADAYLDYRRVDDVNRLNVPIVRRRLARAYRRELPFSQRRFGFLFDTHVADSIERARRHAWRLAQLLAQADTSAARDDVDQLIERRAMVAGQTILRCKGAPGACIAALHEIGPRRRGPFRIRPLTHEPPQWAAPASRMSVT